MLVDCGDWSGSLAYESMKSPFIIDMMELLGYDAMTVGEREFNYSYAFLKQLISEHDLPVVSANIRDKESGRLVFEEYIVVEKQGVKIGITGLLNGEIPMRAGADSLIIDDPLNVAQELIPRMREEADVIVLLAHTGRTEAHDLISQVEGIDVLVIGHRPSLVLRSREINGAVTVSAGSQGQNIGETLLYMDGKQVVQREGRVIILLPKIGERMDIAKLQKDFEDRLNDHIRSTQRDSVVSTNQNASVPHYLGMQACADCHQPQFEQWKTTAHAHAFETLEKQNKEATPDCVGCHVTGWSKVGGFRNAVTTAKLKDVQCEVCHGMGTEHDMFAETSGPPSEQLCITCHTPENDPSWNYAAKLPMVVH